MRLSPVLVTVVAVLALTGCNDDPDDAAAPATESSTPTSTVPETTSTAPTTPVEPSPSTSTPPPSPPATENSMPDVCAVVTAQQMSDVLFFPVELTTTDGGCRYAVPDDADAPAVEYVQTSGFTAADVAKPRITAEQRTGGRLQPIENVGDDAFFAVGPDDNNGQLTGFGGVLVGDTFVEVTLTQNMDQIEPEVGQAMIDAVGLAGDALGG